MITLIKVRENESNKQLEAAIKLAGAMRFLEDKAQAKVRATMDVTPTVERMASQIEFSEEGQPVEEAFKLAYMYHGAVVSCAQAEVAAWLPN